MPEQLVELGIIHVPEGRRVFPRLTVEKILGSEPIQAARARQEKTCRVSKFTAFFQGWRNDDVSQVAAH